MTAIEKAAKIFSQEEVQNAVKALLAKRDLENETNLRDNLLERLDLNYLGITACHKEIKL